eukprot:gnl/MRDRNA2_/MRDRNA2_40714_c0_seq1.p1 gnl/MRDRNA2_/MRDRNA2_40714_c0~~gnl/MRDRNA2_/MRDRNA2_40714_c0_seq1.p1  ORF type:complete len:354 (+),score=49.45 gnl/MRDRNA2_/MRDRNA2_40714_c0_seq1:82-1143(+)
MMSPHVVTMIICMIMAGNGLRVGISSNWDPFADQHGHPHPSATDSKNEPAVPKRKKSNLKVAFCLAGQARTLPEPAVKDSVISFVKQQRETNQMDVFADLTLPGSGPDSWFKEPAINASKSNVKAILEEMKVAKYKLEEAAGEVTEENVDELLVERECHQTGFWSESDRLVRNMNELQHMRGALNKMLEHEKQWGFKYDIVVVARPDLLYRTECHLDFEKIHADAVMYDSSPNDQGCGLDWFFAANRHRMMGMFQHPLQCFGKPQPPLSRIEPHTGENMINHLLDIHNARGTIGSECNIAIYRSWGGSQPYSACHPIEKADWFDPRNGQKPKASYDPVVGKKREQKHNNKQKK